MANTKREKKRKEKKRTLSFQLFVCVFSPFRLTAGSSQVNNLKKKKHGKIPKNDGNSESFQSTVGKGSDTAVSRDA
jgi:hypothetical protein